MGEITHFVGDLTVFQLLNGGADLTGDVAGDCRCEWNRESIAYEPLLRRGKSKERESVVNPLTVSVRSSS